MVRKRSVAVCKCKKRWKYDFILAAYGFCFNFGMIAWNGKLKEKLQAGDNLSLLSCPACSRKVIYPKS